MILLKSILVIQNRKILNNNFSQRGLSSTNLGDKELSSNLYKVDVQVPGGQARSARFAMICMSVIGRSVLPSLRKHR